jgi:hypothetical protein
MLLPGVGGIDRLTASIPLTVRVPVAKRLLKNNDFLISLSRCGVIFCLLPYVPRYSALKLSTIIKIIFFF